MIYVSKSEGFGIPLLEAMRCDVPLVISDQTSLPEVAGDAALVVGINDYEDLGEKMHALDTSEELRERLINKGRNRVSYYTWDRAAAVCYDAIKTAATN
jgi:glycosyltransferase involved in cell wall biosynthesis